MNSKFCKIIKIYSIAMFCLILLFFVRYYIVDLLINCKYLHLEYPLSMLNSLIVGIIIPSILFSGILLICKKFNGKKLNLILSPILAFLLSVSFIPGFYYGYLFGCSHFHSYTDKVSNYGTYDTCCTEKVINEYNLDEFLPSEDLVKKYGKFSYRHYYVLGEHTFVIKTEIQFPDNDSYEKEFNRIHSINSPTEVIVDNIYCDIYSYMYYYSNSMPWKNARRLKSAVFDDASKTIIYVVEYGIDTDSFLSDYLQTKSENST